MQRFSSVLDREDRAEAAGALGEIARLIAIAGGNLVQAAYIGQNTRASAIVSTVLKAAVDAGTTSDPDWAKPVAEYGDIVGAFVEALRSRSVFARVLADGAVRLPLKTRAAVVTANASAWIVGEGLPVPVSGMALAGQSLEEKKAAALIVLTSELVRSTSPSARTLIDVSLKAAVADTIDAAFVDAITDGITPIAATGTTAVTALADLRAMLDIVNTTGTGSLVWAMGADIANRAATLASASGDLVFPAMGPSGGEMFSVPAVVSSAVLSGQLLLIDASGIAAQLETISVSVADQASLQMSTTPDSPPGTSTVLESLWQTNKVALLARAFFGAEVIRPGSVAILDGVEWGD